MLQPGGVVVVGKQQVVQYLQQLSTQNVDTINLRTGKKKNPKKTIVERKILCDISIGNLTSVLESVLIGTNYQLEMDTFLWTL
jgi:hypothetical protein